jgi:uncharacterized membrane protein
MPRWIETIIVFFILIIVLTFIEYLGGILIEKIFGVVFWNYEDVPMHFGKYIALPISLFWGIMSIVLIYIIHPKIDKYIANIPTFITLILIIITFTDLIYLLYKGKIINR